MGKFDQLKGRMCKQHNKCLTSTVCVSTAAASPLSCVCLSPRRVGWGCDLSVNQPGHHTAAIKPPQTLPANSRFSCHQVWCGSVLFLVFTCLLFSLPCFLHRMCQSFPCSWLQAGALWQRQWEAQRAGAGALCSEESPQKRECGMGTGCGLTWPGLLLGFLQKLQNCLWVVLLSNRKMQFCG